MFDVETASLVDWPLAYRTMTLTKANKLKIHTGHVTSVAGYSDIQTFEKNFEQKWLEIATLVKLKQSDPASLKDSSLIVLSTAAGYMAHYHGDESIDATAQSKAARLFYYGGNAVSYGNTILNLFTDLPCPDQDVELDLSKGTFTPL